MVSIPDFYYTDETGKFKEHSISSRWRTMLARCYNPNAINYHSYGGRGIRVCDEWLKENNGKENFATWAYQKYPNLDKLMAQGYQLDRNDNDLGYSPENCEFIPMLANNQNKDDTILVTWIDGKIYPFTELFHKYAVPGLKVMTARGRYVKYKWPIDKCFSTPPRKLTRGKPLYTPKHKLLGGIVMVDFYGGLYPLQEIVKEWSLLPYGTVYSRISKGWETEKALTTPSKGRGRR